MRGGYYLTSVLSAEVRVRSDELKPLLKSALRTLTPAFLLRVRERAGGAALARARAGGDCERPLLDGAEERVLLLSVGEAGVVAAEEAVRVLRVDGPVRPVQRADGYAGVVGGRAAVAALYEVDHVCEVLPLRARPRGEEVCVGLARPYLADEYGSLRVARVARVRPRVRGVTRPHGIDSAREVREGPELLPCVGEARRRAARAVTGGGVEPSLPILDRPVVVARVDELIVDDGAEPGGASARVEDDGRAGVRRVAVDAEEVAAPPVPVVRPRGHVARRGRVGAHALDEDERVLPAVFERVAEDGVARALGGEPPVVARRSRDARGRERVRVRVGRGADAVAVAPRRARKVRGARGRVRLVAKVVADDDGQAVGGVVVYRDGVGAARRLLYAVRPALHAHPVANPLLLGVAALAGDDVPEAVAVGGVARGRAVVVEYDVQALRARVVDYEREYVARALAAARRAGALRVGVRDGVQLPHRVGERDADGVVAVLLYLVDDRRVVFRPEAVRDVVGGLEPVPVDARDSELRAARRDDFAPARR